MSITIVVVIEKRVIYFIKHLIKMLSFIRILLYQSLIINHIKAFYIIFTKLVIDLYSNIRYM